MPSNHDERTDNAENGQMILESIKLAVRSTSYFGISLNTIFQEVIKRLMYYYQEINDPVYLEAAVLHIKAYLQMGLNYDDNNGLFDEVLSLLGKTKSEVLPGRLHASKRIKLTKSEVKSMIFKWPSSKYRQSINEVADDIIFKLQHRIAGIHFYNSNPNPDSADSKGGDLYELVINTEEIYFHDIKRRKYYTFDLKEIDERKPSSN